MLFRSFDYCVVQVSDKPELQGTSVKDSQFKQPLLEFSGSCAGCAETSYARLVTQLFGERMFISNATGCSSIWGGPAATSPYTVNKDGFGPAWSNSLFEDNAEHVMGMMLGYKAVQNQLATLVEQLRDYKHATDELKQTTQAWLDAREDAAASKETTAALIEVLEAEAAKGCPIAPQILEKKQYLTKKSFWIFGGDGWADRKSVV